MPRLVYPGGLLSSRTAWPRLGPLSRERRPERPARGLRHAGYLSPLASTRYETAMKTLLGYFWRGCLVLLPVGATFYLAYLVVATFDRLVPVGIPGLGFALALALVTLVGFMTSNVLGRSIVATAERWLTSLPFLKLVYTSIRDLVHAFVGDRKAFDQPVAVPLFPGSSSLALGYVTRDTMEKLGMSDHVAVYFPQSYNFAGNVLLVPRDQVVRLQVSNTDLMTFIVSGGVSGLGVEPPTAARPPRKPTFARTILGIGPRDRR
jgi:uncharacterized membrane protein